jgi:NADPH:quinone reductase-like Zn-dependent oxidoreductase
MTAAVTMAHGGPDTIELRTDWPTPRVGPGQALVEVTAAGVNNTDIWSRRGAYGTAGDPDAVAGWRGVPLTFPRIQGPDVVGVVSRVGSPDDAGLVGRKVLVDPITVYEDGFPAEIIGSESDGGFAEFHLSPVDRLHDVTGTPLSDPELACLPTAYGTAIGMINRAGCKAGERVLVTGASGGVGMAAVQILVARGSHVVAYTSPEKATMVSAAGPSEVAVRGRDEIASIPEVDAVVDVVGGPEFGSFVDRLRPGGRLVTAGAIAGPVVQFDIRRLYLPQRTFIGSTMHTREDFTALTQMARTGVLEPIVADVFPLTEIAAAQRRFESKDFVGKLALVP